MYRLLSESRKGLPSPASRILGSIWWLFLISWMLYPGGYLMPVLLNSEAGVVGRQITYTVADIASKVIYGVLLARVAQIRSEAEGYREEPAVKVAA